jgi:hypothetical protein
MAAVKLPLAVFTANNTSWLYELCLCEVAPPAAIIIIPEGLQVRGLCEFIFCTNFCTTGSLALLPAFPAAFCLKLPQGVLVVE